MALFSSWGTDVGFWLSDASIKIYTPKPGLIQGNSETCVDLECAKNWPLPSKIF